MNEYSTPDFEMINKEVAESISTLRRHGLNINIGSDFLKKLDPYFLFDGDDGLFKSILPSVKNYFEYGCGKSTEYVYKNTTANIYAVDTSKEWVGKVRNIANDNQVQRLHVNWVDVGELGDWGTPVSFAKRANFIQYANSPWNSGVAPDLILIDGRFRVYCFLTSVYNAPLGTKILFDDYMNRPEYHVAEEFLDIREICGRQALFVVNEIAKKSVTQEVVDEFKNVVG